MNNFDYPDWMDSGYNYETLSQITKNDHGNMGGTYMPSQTYHLANDTMHEHGNEVLEYIEDSGVTLTIQPDESWCGFTSRVLNTAVVMKVHQMIDQFDDEFGHIENECVKDDLEDWDLSELDISDAGQATHYDELVTECQQHYDEFEAGQVPVPVRTGWITAARFARADGFERVSDWLEELHEAACADAEAIAE